MRMSVFSNPTFLLAHNATIINDSHAKNDEDQPLFAVDSRNEYEIPNNIKTYNRNTTVRANDKLNQSTAIMNNNNSNVATDDNNNYNATIANNIRDSGMNQDQDHSSGRGSALFDSPSLNQMNSVGPGLMMGNSYAQNGNASYHNSTNNGNLTMSTGHSGRRPLPPQPNKENMNQNSNINSILGPVLEFSKTAFEPSIPGTTDFVKAQIKQIFSKNIKYEKFESIYESRSFEDLSKEFDAIPKMDKNRSTNVGLNNQHKSRYNDIDPYDFNRVRLPFDPIEEQNNNVNNNNNISLNSMNSNNNDFINASHITGFANRKYIAAMGPKKETIADFWRMIWDKNIQMIVMLTNITEGDGQEKCAKYWPFRSGNLIIELIEEIILGDYIQRKFRFLEINSNQSREISHLQFTSWPDFGTPSISHGLVKLIRKIKFDYWDKEQNPQILPPLVVHCSAGVGRTGTFIALDNVIDHMNNEDILLKDKSVNIFSLICHLRKQRPYMVQSFDQYKFIYNTIGQLYRDGDTEVEISELAFHFEGLEQMLPGAKTGLCHEFDKLEKINQNYSKDPAYSNKIATSMEFEHLNFSAALTPYDKNIVPITNNINNIYSVSNNHNTSYLSNGGGYNKPRYINASWIDGYFLEKTYIATQTPLNQSAGNQSTDTKGDFWQMCFDQNTEIIICLESPEELQQNSSNNSSHFSKNSYFPDKQNDILTLPDFQIFCNRNSLYNKFDNLLPNGAKNDSFILRELQLQSLNGLADDTAAQNDPLLNPESNNNEIKFIYHIQIKDWDKPLSNHSSTNKSKIASNLERLKSAEKIVDILNLIERIKDSSINGNKVSNKPVIVHDQGGCGRTGAFLCIANSVEQVKTEGTVDIYQTVKNLRHQRRKMIQSLDQYRFCYITILSYIDSMGDYANFK